MAAHDDVELRGMVSRSVVDILDAVSSARRMPRNELAHEILTKWANEQIHVATLIQRVTRSNPPPSDSGRISDPTNSDRDAA